MLKAVGSTGWFGRPALLYLSKILCNIIVKLPPFAPIRQESQTISAFVWHLLLSLRMEASPGSVRDWSPHDNYPAAVSRQTGHLPAVGSVLVEMLCQPAARRRQGLHNVNTIFVSSGTLVDCGTSSQQAEQRDYRTGCTGCFRGILHRLIDAERRS